MSVSLRHKIHLNDGFNQIPDDKTMPLKAETPPLTP